MGNSFHGFLCQGFTQTPVTDDLVHGGVVIGLLDEAEKRISAAEQIHGVLCVGNAAGTFFIGKVTAPGIAAGAAFDACLHRVLENISEHSHEILVGFHVLAPVSILEQVTNPLVFLVIPVNIFASDSFEDLG